MAKKTRYKVDGLDCAEEVAILKKEIGEKMGSVAVRLGLMSAKEVNLILDEQKNLKLLIGLILQNGGI